MRVTHHVQLIDKDSEILTSDYLRRVIIVIETLEDNMFGKLKLSWRMWIRIHPVQVGIAGGWQT